MKILSRLAVGTKLALVMTFILALVSLWIYLYFPPRLQREAVKALTQRASAIADLTAFSIAPALQTRDRVATAAALTALRRNPDLIFFMVQDVRGQTFASFNEMVAESAGPFRNPLQEPFARRAVITGMTMGNGSETTGALSEDGNSYETTTPIRYRGKKIGTLIVGFSLDRHGGACVAHRVCDRRRRRICSEHIDYRTASPHRRNSGADRSRRDEQPGRSGKQRRSRAARANVQRDVGSVGRLESHARAAR
ncbi:MAG: hypothetical protein DMF17_13180 [Verrucomicrobia bacterium]|nr:MAG: hypothetical protein DMF17_13180 [Verrucomicrobiota bacterium]